MRSSIQKYAVNYKQLFIFIKIIISILVLAFLIHMISLKEIVSAIANANKYSLLLGLLLLGLNLFLQFKKWQLLVKLEKPTTKSREVFLSLLAGITLGFITPGRLGEFGRSLFIPNARWSHLFSFILVDKLLVLFYVILFGMIGLIYFIKSYVTLYYWIIISVLAFAIEILMVFLLVKPTLVKKTVTPLVRRYSILGKITEGFKKLDARVLKRLILLNFFYYFTFAIQFYFLVDSFFQLSFLKCMISIFAILFVKTMLPIAVGDLGVREGASILFLSHFNVPEAAAFNASLMLFVINILLPSLAGFLFILKNRFQISLKK